MDDLDSLLARLEKGELDQARASWTSVDENGWKLQTFPDSRIILLRHGQSEGNVDHLLYTSKGDSRLELTQKGIRQAKEAGKELQKLVRSVPLESRGPTPNIIVCISPFERFEWKKSELDAFTTGQSRRPNAESSADVFDRVTQFWDKLFGDFTGNGMLTRDEVQDAGLFEWSVETFGTVWNLGNCEYVTLKKNLETCSYEILGSKNLPGLAGAPNQQE
eukprot:Skav216705  [mRNA]  locus=scaffold91:493825:501053:+ [translate_table: standard]